MVDFMFEEIVVVFYFGQLDVFVVFCKVCVDEVGVFVFCICVLKKFFIVVWVVNVFVQEWFGQLGEVLQLVREFCEVQDDFDVLVLVKFGWDWCVFI